MNQEKYKKDSGFTLIELLVVIIILGILATIVIVNVSTARSSAVSRACQTDAVNIRQALDQYSIDNNGLFPVATSGATSYVTANLSSTLKPTYLRSIPAMTGTGAPASADYFLSIAITTSGTTVTSVGTIQGFTVSTATPTTTTNKVPNCTVE